MENFSATMGYISSNMHLGLLCVYVNEGDTVADECTLKTYLKSGLKYGAFVIPKSERDRLCIKVEEFEYASEKHEKQRLHAALANYLYNCGNEFFLNFVVPLCRPSDVACIKNAVAEEKNDLLRMKSILDCVRVCVTRASGNKEKYLLSLLHFLNLTKAIRIEEIDQRDRILSILEMFRKVSHQAANLNVMCEEYAKGAKDSAARDVFWENLRELLKNNPKTVQQRLNELRYCFAKKLYDYSCSGMDGVEVVDAILRNRTDWKLIDIVERTFSTSDDEIVKSFRRRLDLRVNKDLFDVLGMQDTLDELTECDEIEVIESERDITIRVNA